MAPTVAKAMAVLGSHCHSYSFLSCAEFLICLANIGRKQQQQRLRVTVGLRVCRHLTPATPFLFPTALIYLLMKVMPMWFNSFNSFKQHQQHSKVKCKALLLGCLVEWATQIEIFRWGWCGTHCTCILFFYLLDPGSKKYKGYIKFMEWEMCVHNTAQVPQGPCNNDVLCTAPGPRILLSLSHSLHLSISLSLYVCAWISYEAKVKLGHRFLQHSPALLPLPLPLQHWLLPYFCVRQFHVIAYTWCWPRIKSTASVVR